MTSTNMPLHSDSSLSKPEDIDTRSLVSLQELDPSPIAESPDLETGEYFSRPDELESSPKEEVSESRFSLASLGLRGHRWDSWCTS